MDNVIVYEDQYGIEQVLIKHEDGSMTGMSKAHYDLQQLEHLTEIPTPDEA